MEVRFGPGYGSGDVRLFEVDSELLPELESSDSSLCIKGSADSEAVLCSATRSFSVRAVESSNTLLLAHHTPNKDSLVVRASCFCIHELRAVSLGQQQLKELLSRAPYAGRLSDEATAAKYSLAQLSTLVQCSRKELSDAIAKLDAFELDGFVRIMDRAYESRVLEYLVSVVQEGGWSWNAVPSAAVIKAVSEEFDAESARIILSKYSTASENGNVRLDYKRILRATGEVLLKSKAVWVADEFVQSAVSSLGITPPEGEKPDLSLWFGCCVVDDKSSRLTLRYLDPESLPLDAEARFASLFAAKPVWTLQQMQPFVESLVGPGQQLEQLLIRHCYVNRMDPKIVTLSKR